MRPTPLKLAKRRWNCACSSRHFAKDAN